MRGSWKKAFGRTQLLGFVPVITLGAFWAGGEFALYATALALPLLFALVGGMRERPLVFAERDPLTGLIMRDGLIAWANHAVTQKNKPEKQVAVIALSFDDLAAIEERFGQSMRDSILRETANRLQPHLRDDDVLARLEGGFALGLQDVPSQEVETLLALVDRLLATLQDPFSDGPTRTYCTMSAGIAAESHIKVSSGANLVIGAQTASEYAVASGAGSVRVYGDGMSSDRGLDRDTAHELAAALEAGEIVAWFQPQIDISTNRVIGFEALARWDHPERGMISPAVFLPEIEANGLSQRLAEVILKQSLMAMNTWDASGFQIGTVSVNFSSDELRNPRLPDYIRWELDRHDLAPERLTVEVLETVAADSNEDIIARNLTTLSRLGCNVDLDDFGTGLTCFINIRRFDVTRIKIDRSLVSQIDLDPEQRRMFSALLAFSSKLGVETLAEGVETEEEITTLRQLGCTQAQGFVVSRPMALGDTLIWLEENGQLVIDRVRNVSRSA